MFAIRNEWTWAQTVGKDKRERNIVRQTEALVSATNGCDLAGVRAMADRMVESHHPCNIAIYALLAMTTVGSAQDVMLARK